MVITQSLPQLDFPDDLTAMLEDVWTQITRYVIYEGEVDPEPLAAGEMVMQGDSFGPFALHVLTTAGVRWTASESRIQNIKKKILVYMDSEFEWQADV